MAILDAISTLLLRHFFLLITVALVGVKLLLIRVSSSKTSLMRTLLSVPSDLSYISLSFVVAALARTANGIISLPASWRHPKADLVLLAILAIAVCTAIHWLDDRKSAPRLETWIASNSVQKADELDVQMKFFEKQTTDGIDVVRIHALLGLLGWFLFELVLACIWLEKTVKILSL